MAEKKANTPNTWQVEKAIANLKNITFILSITLPIITGIIWAFWNAGGRSWLSAEIQDELDNAKYRGWYYEQMVEVFQNLTPEEVTEIKNTTKLESIVRGIIRDEMSGGNLKDLTALKASRNTIIKAIMNPPVFESLEAIVTERVDAIYTFELYDRRKLQVFFSGAENEATRETLQNISVSDLTARFYAASNQQITVSIQPNYGADWRQAISNGSETMILKIGGRDVEIGLGPKEVDITCDIRKGLGLRADGMVQIRANPKSGSFDKQDGFQLDITIVARKGEESC